jgi:predicted glycosyltransferase
METTCRHVATSASPEQLYISISKAEINRQMHNQEFNSAPIRIGKMQHSGCDGTLLVSGAKTAQKTIWIDLDNSPHVPFFAPIIKELENRGHTVLLTARDFAQVTQLAKLMHLQCNTIGRHYGKNTLAKLAGVAIRAGQLAPVVRRANPDLAVSHGSRAQLLLSTMLRVPSVIISDYEHATDFKVIRPGWIIAPKVIPSGSWDIPGDRVLHYPGIKEDVYVPQFVPDLTLLTQLNLSERSILVTLRPPASHAHYHNPESDGIFVEVVNWLIGEQNVVTVLLPRTAGQEQEIRKQWAKYFDAGKLIVPSQAVDGLSLMWHSDLVISGGGTMNREAAALHVPVYSTFRGKIGAIDQYLVAQKRLVLVESVAEVRTRIRLAKRDRHIETYGNTATLTSIVDHIDALLERECQRA